ncbi:MAG: hypothetical protein ABFE02_00230 [Sulfuricella sp.]
MYWALTAEAAENDAVRIASEEKRRGFDEFTPRLDMSKVELTGEGTSFAW